MKVLRDKSHALSVRLTREHLRFLILAFDFWGRKIAALVQCLDNLLSLSFWMKFYVHVFWVWASSFDWFKLLGRNVNLTRVVNDMNIKHSLNFFSVLNGIDITVTLHKWIKVVYIIELKYNMWDLWISSPLSAVFLNLIVESVYIKCNLGCFELISTSTSCSHFLYEIRKTEI